MKCSGTPDLVRINRNILECKAGYVNDGIFDELVLIETYWNVKRSPAAEPASDPSINRNILECKVAF